MKQLSLAKSNPIIALKNINKSFTLGNSQNRVLKNITLEIKEGELVAIMGASGSGKSSLLNILGLLDTPSQGLYTLAGQNTNTLSKDELANFRNKYIGFVFQQFHLLPRLTVTQNIELPLLYSSCKSKKSSLLTQDLLRQVGMSAYSFHLPNQLSGGQQQRVAIARALINNPRVILADEPTGALDSKTGKEITDLFLDLNKKGTTVVIVTHDEKIAKLCKRQIIIQDGEILVEELSEV